MSISKIKELINILDPTKIQCTACKKWFNIKFDQLYILKYRICIACYVKNRDKYKDKQSIESLTNMHRDFLYENSKKYKQQSRKTNQSVRSK